jgi:hypothetical protein
MRKVLNLEEVSDRKTVKCTVNCLLKESKKTKDLSQGYSPALAKKISNLAVFE